jgi:hypothetical protein
MVESDVYETKKSFVNVTCYLRFQKCPVAWKMRLFMSYSQIFPIYCPCIRRYDDLYTSKVWNRKQEKNKKINWTVIF